MGEGLQQLFASPQCTGYNNEYKLTEDLCWPTKKSIAKKTRDMVKQYKANSVFIATDNDPYTSVIENELKTLKKTVSLAHSYLSQLGFPKMASPPRLQLYILIATFSAGYHPSPS